MAPCGGARPNGSFSWTGSRSFVPLIRGLEDPAQRAVLSGRAVQGDDDGVLPFPKTGQRLSGLMSDVQTVVIDGGPHAIAWTHADQLNSALVKFMA